MKKIALSWILCVLALIVLLAWLGRGLAGEDKTIVTNEAALIHGTFTLQSAKGETVTEKNFQGRYMLVYFGYTHCPDMCPASLLLMQNALSHLGPLAKKVQPLFITLDPARDTAAITNDYAHHFGDAMIGLSGTPDQTAAAAEHFKVYYSRVEEKHSALGYSMDHSGFIYLMGPNAEYLTHFAYNAPERELEEGLRRYVH